MAKGANRDKGREARWRRIVGQHARSGLTIRQFCRDNDLTESAFYFWRCELQRRDRQRPQRRRGPVRQGQDRQRGSMDAASRQPASATFVPVSISPQSRSQAADIEIVLPGGARVRVGSEVNRRALADVVAVLQEAR